MYCFTACEMLIYYVVCFHVYDVDGDGMISRNELLHILKAALQEDKDESELLYIVMMIFRGTG